MPSQAFTETMLQGVAIDFTNLTELNDNILDVKYSEGLQRKAIGTLDLTDDTGWETFVGSDVKTPGTLTITYKFSTQIDYWSLFEDEKCDTVEITYKKRATTCGGAVASTAATLTFDVVWTECKPEYEGNEISKVVCTFKISGKPTQVDAATA